MREEKCDCVILFDGACTICNVWVDFILRRDSAKRFRFAPLQTEAGRSLLARHGYSANELATVLLIDEGMCYDRSTAVLRIFRRLDGFWPMLYAFMVVPRRLRDAMYTAIARKRYRWFGIRGSCRVPTAEERERFIADSEGEEE